MARMLSIVLALTALLVSGLASADENRLGLSLNNMVSGRSLPSIVIQPQEQVSKITVDLKRADGKKSRVSASNVAAGTKRELKVQQDVGSYEYKAHFKVTWGGGTAPSDFKMKFTLTRVGKLQLTIKPDEVDLGERKMVFRINNPASKAELTIVGTSGQKLVEVKRAYNRAAGGTALEIRWKDPGGDVSHYDLKVYDVAGFWKGVRLTPFSVKIDHDDVEFANGKWAIRRSEEPKLKNTMGQIREALAKHAKLVNVNLYVAGYTDTVGSEKSNDRLSKNRARSIARWFRRHGLKIPIFYQGFGERVLAVNTPDETPEPRNRRALYILATQTPSKGGQLPDDDWKEIR